MQSRVQEEKNPLSRVLMWLYAGVHKLDSKNPLTRSERIPSIATQRVFAIILLVCQTGITFTGSLVRVTGSGLGCDTWPQCHPGSFVPKAGAAPWIHQAIEFGNRLLTFVLIAAALVVFVALIRAGRRTLLLHMAFLQGIGIIVQAVIGGITVRLDLAWWMVAAHFLPSMILVFFAAVLVVRIGEPDDGQRVELMPRALIYLTHGSALALAVVLSTGTLVTSAGPHAGDEAILPEHRLQIELLTIANLHAHSMYLYLGLTIGLLAGLFALNVDRKLKATAGWLIAAIVFQALIGIIQFRLGVPTWTVPVHVLGSGVTALVTGLLWGQRQRLMGGNASHTGSVEADAQLVNNVDYARTS
ncbi:COX15/CtaA family protein [Corynebacterium urogenitale]